MPKIHAGDKVIRNTATANQDKVHIGDTAPVFGPIKIRAGDKVTRDTSTINVGKIHLGDTAPVFSPKK